MNGHAVIAVALPNIALGVTSRGDVSDTDREVDAYVRDRTRTTVVRLNF
jgi:hypothetical protein